MDRTGTLWVGTVGGVNRYDRESGRFIHYPEVAESVTALYSAPDGTLWVGTAGAGLFHYDPTSDRFLPVPASLSDLHTLTFDRLGNRLGLCIADSFCSEKDLGCPGEEAWVPFYFSPAGRA